MRSKKSSCNVETLTMERLLINRFPFLCLCSLSIGIPIIFDGRALAWRLHPGTKKARKGNVGTSVEWRLNSENDSRLHGQPSFTRNLMHVTSRRNQFKFVTDERLPWKDRARQRKPDDDLNSILKCYTVVNGEPFADWFLLFILWDNFLNSSFWSLHLLAFWFIFVSRPEGYSSYKREDGTREGS